VKAVFILLATLLAGNAFAQKVTWAPKSDQGFDQAMEERRFILQFFVKPKCAECALLERTVFKDPDITSFIAERFIAIRSDYATPNGKNDAENYGIETFPTVLFYNSRGELIERATLAGSVGSDEFLQHILNVTAGKFQTQAVQDQISTTGQAVKTAPPSSTSWSKPDTTAKIVPPPLPDTASSKAP